MDVTTTSTPPVTAPRGTTTTTSTHPVTAPRGTTTTTSTPPVTAPRGTTTTTSTPPVTAPRLNMDVDFADSIAVAVMLKLEESGRLLPLPTPSTSGQADHAGRSSADALAPSLTPRPHATAIEALSDSDDDVDAMLDDIMGDRQSQTKGTMARCNTGANSSRLATRSTHSLEHELFRASLATSTRKSYRRSVGMLRIYVSSVAPGSRTFPVSRKRLAGFIVHLFRAKYASSTILSTVSAIAYSHKIVGLGDPADDFFIKKLLVGIQKKSRTVDLRRPIDLKMLSNLVAASKAIISDKFTQLCIAAMFMLHSKN